MKRTSEGTICYELVGFGDKYDHVEPDSDTPVVASKVLQYMVRGVYDSWSMPVAYYEYR